MSLWLRALGVVLAIGGTVAACSSSREPIGGGASGPSAIAGNGALGLQLTLAGGEHISTVNYTLQNASVTKKGSYNVSATTSLSFVIGSVPAGSGYAISLTATSDDGSVTCAFPAPGDAIVGNITVVDDTTTQVSVNMQCTVNQGMDAGSVLLYAATSNCPVWNTIVANPANVTVDAGLNVSTDGQIGTTAEYPSTANVPALIYQGQSLVLVGSATAPNPGAVTFQWTANGGSISSPSGTIDPNSNDAGVTNQTLFTCPASGTGTYTITLVLADGPLPPGGGCDTAFTTGSVTVTCAAPPNCPFGTGCGDGGQICNVAGSCVQALFSVLVVTSLDGGNLDGSGAAMMLPMSIQSYNLAGVQIGSSIAIPSIADGGTTQHPVTLMGNDLAEGDLTTSSNGRYLTLTGWGTAAGVTQTGSTPAVIALVDSLGNVDTSTVAGGAFSTGSPASYRSAISYDGTEFWVSGAVSSGNDNGGGGIWYVPFAGSTATQLVSLPNSAIDMGNDSTSRWLRIFNQQVFSGSDWAPPYMFNIASGAGPLPTSGTFTPATLPGYFSTLVQPDGGTPASSSSSTWAPSPYGFLLFDLVSPPGPDTMYIADDGINPNGRSESGQGARGTVVDTSGAGLSKWTYTAGNGWAQVWNVTAGTWPTSAGTIYAGQPIGYRGLSGFATGTNVTLMATTADIAGQQDSLAVLINDTQAGTAPPTPQIVATTAPNQVFRGVALTPQ